MILQTFFYQNSCLLICPNLTYSNNATYQCSSCVFPCLTCTDSLNCISCQIGFLNTSTFKCDLCPSSSYADYTSKICISCNTSLSNCQICINSTFCTSCFVNYYLYHATCINSSFCLSLSGYYLNTQQSTCSECLSPCKTCTT